MQSLHVGSSRRPVGISRRDIVEAALEIVRAGGVATLSMRALASALGIQAPTLYHHVRDKAALLDLISAEAFRTLDRPEDAYDDVPDLAAWAAALRADVVRLRHLYEAHPGLARAVVDYGRMEDTTPADSGADPHGKDTTSAPPELSALIRLGVRREPAQDIIEAGARWTMAVLATEDSVADPTIRDRLFHDGLDLLLRGMVAALADAAAT